MEKAAAPDFPPRLCQGCGQQIPFFTKSGAQKKASVYAQRIYCGLQCRADAGRGRRPGQSLEQYLDNIIDKSGGNDSCWPVDSFFWQKPAPKNYGKFTFRGKRQWAHQAAFKLSGGTIAAKSQVMHLCNNAPCCNPRHLQLGSNNENQAYRKLCGRSAGRKGADNWKTALNAEQLRWLQDALIAGTTDVQAIQAKFNISNVTAWDAAFGRRAYKNHAAVCPKKAAEIRTLMQARLGRRVHKQRRKISAEAVATARRDFSAGRISAEALARRLDRGKLLVYRLLYGKPPYHGVVAGQAPLVCARRWKKYR